MASAQVPTQQPPPPDTKTRDTPDQSNNPSDDSESVEHPIAVVSTSPPIRQISSAGFLTSGMSPLRWGPVYISFAQFSQILDQGSSFNGQESFQDTASQISTGIVFDKQFRKVRVAVQYVPRITVLNGQFIGDFVNQDTGINTVISLTPRLSVDLADHFVYYKSADAWADVFLSSDSFGGGTFQRDFIQSPGTWLSNSAAATFTYAVNARTRITVQPNYLYADTSSPVGTTSFSTVHEYGTEVRADHDLTASSNIGILYRLQYDVYPGVTYQTTFQTLEGTYSHSLKGGWSVSGGGGFITANRQGTRIWSGSGFGSVVKAFRRSSAALAYYRGHTFSGYISQQVSDRIDASYQQYIGWRWTLRGGVGYSRDLATANGIWGKYGEGQLSFGITPTISLFGSYVYRWQKGDNLTVLSGNTNYLRCGIQWVPRQVSR
jgi:hypothetical protein